LSATDRCNWLSAKIDIDTLDEAPRHLAYAGFVGQPERGSQLFAVDAAGGVLGPPFAPYR
jgi:hypothetical protein